MDKENKNSPARIAANNRYNEKAYDRINVAVPKGVKAKIEEHIKNTADPSVNAFVKRAINETMEKDNIQVLIAKDVPQEELDALKSILCGRGSFFVEKEKGE